MKSILTLFLSISSYTAIITMIFPIIAAIRARKQGAVFQFDLKLFEFYYYIATIIQFTVLTTAWIGYFIEPFMLFARQFRSYLFIFLTIVHVIIFLFLLLKWAGLKKYYIPLIIIITPIMIVADHFTDTLYPHLMTWTNVLILLIASFILSLRIDKLSIKLPREYNFIHLGIYIYCLVTIIGFAPNSSVISEIRIFGSFLHALASILVNYYFYRSFKCLYL
jgi:hypothetical protein